MNNENTNDRLYIDESESGFVRVLYYERDDGLDLGTELYIEQASVPTLTEMLSQCLIQSEIERRCGNDSFRVEQFYDVRNRRAGEVPHSGLSGFVMNKFDAEDFLKLLSNLTAKTSTETAKTSAETATTSAETATTSADIPATTSAEETREMLNRQLLEAAANGDLTALGKSLTSGADVDAHNQHKQSALSIAAEKGHLYAVAILLTAGADIENLDVADKTPLMAASFHGKTQVTYLLLRYGAVINQDLLSSLKLKVDIFEENAGGSGMVDSELTAAWRKFYDSMIEKWHQQNETASP